MKTLEHSENTSFSGLYTAILTPFSGQQIDWESYHRLIQRQVAAQVRGIVVCGTTGESGTISHEEHMELVDKAVKYAESNMQVIAGTGSNSTSEAIDLSLAAKQSGADALMLVSPYYNKPTQKGLIEHFIAIADAVEIPVLLYNIPHRTAVNIELESLKILSEHVWIQGVKEASGDFKQMLLIQHAFRNRSDFCVLCGDDNLTPAAMGIGADGLVSVASNLYPRRFSRMLSYYKNGDFQRANTVFYEFLELIEFLFIRTNPIPTKAASSLMDLCLDELRLPMLPLEAPLKARLAKLLEALGEDP